MQPPRSAIHVEEIQRVELMGLADEAASFLTALLPFVLGLQALLLALRPNLPRAAVIGVAATALLIGVWRDRRRTGRGAEQVALILPKAAMGIGLHYSLLLVIGCLSSPALPVFILVSTVMGALLGQDPRLRWLRRAQIGAIWTLAAIQLAGGNAIFAPTWLGQDQSAAVPLVSATVMTGMIFASSRIGRRMRSISDLMLGRAVLAREELLESHAERARELEALSGEIAHELKNPLASVKGLAALLARDLSSGKPAERLDVLRGEADRMQGILEEFLNFSRPAVPVRFEVCELSALCAEVADLHEGMASSRGQRLEIEGGGSAPVDRRKMKQILINLVQNALHASPDGGAVLLRVRARASEAHITVEDEGPGLDAGLGGRAFDAGVTTKERGSGLGLTIARALARQHGGELTLEARAGGGCVARVSVPLQEAP